MTKIDLINKLKTIKNWVWENPIKSFFGAMGIVALGILVPYAYNSIFNRFYKLIIEKVEIKIITEKYVNCPSQPKIYAIIKTGNQDAGTIYYKFFNETSKEDISDYAPLKISNETGIGYTDTLKNFNIEKSTEISVCYEIFYDNMIGSDLNKRIEKLDKIKNTNKTSSILIKCAEEYPGMVFVEGGKLRDNNVRVEGFFADINEVSYAEFKAFCNSRITMPSSGLLRNERINVPENERFQDFYPALNITWVQAKNYCESVDKRLPTMIEWEYMNQSGNSDKSYNEPHECLDVISSFDELIPNSVGIKGICCNAYEWCSDSMDRKPNFKSLKGFNSFWESTISENVKYHKKNLSTDTIGFRCIKSISIHEK
jgi:hypothetical protein